MKTKTILISGGILGGIFLIYWFFIRKKAGKFSSTAGELEDLGDTFKRGNPYNAKTVVKLNDTYAVAENDNKDALIPSWQIKAGQPREEITRAQFDAKVLTTIRKIIVDAQSGETKWLDSIKKQMVEAWRPISLSGNNTTLAEALAYEARYYNCSLYYYDAPTPASSETGELGPQENSDTIEYNGETFLPTNMQGIYYANLVSGVTGEIESFYYSTLEGGLITAKDAKLLGVSMN